MSILIISFLLYSLSLKEFSDILYLSLQSYYIFFFNLIQTYYILESENNNFIKLNYLINTYLIIYIVFLIYLFCFLSYDLNF